MPNHITNSTFEGQAGAAGVAPTGWSVVTSTPDVNQDGGFEWANQGYMPSNLNASGGTNYLTLFAQSNKLEAIGTTLNTSVVAGQSYTFSFNYYVNDTNGSTNQGGATTFEIVVGTQVIQIPISSVGVSAPYWQTTSVTFTAAATTSSLTIRNTNDPGALNSYTGIALDNLTLDRALDFVVEGTSGADLIDGAYTGDPQGDRVDNGDAANGSNDDVIRAGGGNDTVLAGNGNDSVQGDAGDDSLVGGIGADSLYGGIGNDALFGGDDNDQLHGDAGNDILSGGSGADQSFGGDGADIIVGLDGGDRVFGGADADTIHGKPGDVVVGGETTMAGGTDNDVLVLNYADVVSITYADGDPESGTVTFVGGGTLTFSQIENVVFQGPVDGTSAGEVMLSGHTDANGDQIDGTDGNNDLIFGNGGNDWIEAASGNDTIFGGTGDDRIYGQSGNDLAYGGEGNDYIWMDEVSDTIGGTNDTAYGGTGDDTIFGRYGDDLIYGGVGNDELHGGPGADTVYGEEGNDILHGGNDLVADTFYGGIGVDSLYGNQGNDSLFGGDDGDVAYGGEEDDSIEGGAGDDTLYGDAGNDALLGDLGNDELSGGEGDDRIEGWSGQDSLFGGAGNDTLNAGAGNDLLLADVGDDSLEGGDGADWLEGGLGDDTLYGGIDSDYLSGGEGNDIVAGGEGNDPLAGDEGDDLLSGGLGNDTLTGGDGADTILGANDRDIIFGGINDSVSGGEGGDDYDVLDLRAWGHPATNIIYDANNPENGTVEFLDAVGKVIGTLTFEGIEKVVACFTPGSMVLTDIGEVAVQDLAAGDRVLTRDNGYEEIRWVGRRDLSHAELIVEPRFNPVFIAKGALGGGLPERDMRVSPQHRLLLAGPRAELLFGEYEVLAAAKYLLGLPGIEQRISKEVSYVHMLFDQHEIVSADGIWSESFQPGDQTLDGLDGDSRAELLAIFPELAQGMRFESARLTLKPKEALAMLHA